MGSQGGGREMDIGDGEKIRLQTLPIKLNPVILDGKMLVMKKISKLSFHWSRTHQTVTDNDSDMTCGIEGNNETRQPGKRDR